MPLREHARAAVFPITFGSWFTVGVRQATRCPLTLRLSPGPELLWQRDDELADDLALSESSERLGGVLERVATLDDRGHEPVFE